MSEKGIFKVIDQLVPKEDSKAISFVIFVKNCSHPLCQVGKLYILDELIVMVELVEDRRPIIELERIDIDA